jgi:hypothetical protein
MHVAFEPCAPLHPNHRTASRLPVLYSLDSISHPFIPSVAPLAILNEYRPPNHGQFFAFRVRFFDVPFTCAIESTGLSLLPMTSKPELGSCSWLESEASFA